MAPSRRRIRWLRESSRSDEEELGVTIETAWVHKVKEGTNLKQVPPPGVILGRVGPNSITENRIWRKQEKYRSG